MHPFVDPPPEVIVYSWVFAALELYPTVLSGNDPNAAGPEPGIWNLESGIWNLEFFKTPTPQSSYGPRFSLAADGNSPADGRTNSIQSHRGTRTWGSSGKDLSDTPSR